MVWGRVPLLIFLKSSPDNSGTDFELRTSVTTPDYGPPGT